MKQKLKKLMKNKKAVALIALVLVLLICLILIKSVFFPGHGSKYGNRLDGINKISFTRSDKSSITKFISDNDKVTEAFLIRLLSSILLISTNQPTVRKRIQFLNF